MKRNETAWLQPRVGEKTSLAVLSIMVVLMFVCTCIMGVQGAYMPTEGIELRIIMYHSVLKDPARTGMYVVTPQQLRADFEYLRAEGYETVLPSELAAYVSQGAPLPQKCVMLTFDDGHYNNLTYLMPLLEEFSYTAVISVVGKFTQLYTQLKDKNPNYAYLSYEDLVQIEQSGLVEIANHTYNLHHNDTLPGSGKANGESVDAYRARLKDDLELLQNELVKNGVTRPICYTYPYGIISSASVDTVKECGFMVSLSCRERPNTITRDPESLYLLNRYNRSGLTTTAEFMKKAGI